MPDCDEEGKMVKKSKLSRKKQYKTGAGRIVWGEGISVGVDKRAKKQAEKDEYVVNEKSKKSKRKKKRENERRDSVLSTFSSLRSDSR